MTLYAAAVGASRQKLIFSPSLQTQRRCSAAGSRNLAAAPPIHPPTHQRRTSTAARSIHNQLCVLRCSMPAGQHARAVNVLALSVIPSHLSMSLSFQCLSVCPSHCLCALQRMEVTRGRRMRRPWAAEILTDVQRCVTAMNVRHQHTHTHTHAHTRTAPVT